MKTKVSLIRCTTYEGAAVQQAVTRAVDLIGGIGAFVRPGETILLKPNLLSAREPERGVTTHPEVVRALVRLVRSAGATPVIGDSPGGAVKGVERVWERTGMRKVAREEGVELVNFETSGSAEKRIAHRTVPAVHVSKSVLNADGIINIPKLKTHNLTIFTGALKNLYGCIPGLRKAEYHKLAPHPDEFGALIGEIYLIVEPKLRFSLIDGVIGMEGSGPSSGDLRQTDLITACADAVALDTAVTHLLGCKPDKIETLRYLSSKKPAESDLRNIEIVGNSPSSFALQDFKFPSTWYIHYVPHFLINFLGKHIWMKPFIVPELCTNCLMCVRSCPVMTIREIKGGKPVVEQKDCISCLCCHELCPSRAIELRSSFLSKIIIRQ